MWNLKKWYVCLVTQLCPMLCDPLDYSLPGTSVCGDSPGKITGASCSALLQGDLPNPGIVTESLRSALERRHFLPLACHLGNLFICVSLPIY